MLRGGRLSTTFDKLIWKYFQWSNTARKLSTYQILLFISSAKFQYITSCHQLNPHQQLIDLPNILQVIFLEQTCCHHNGALMKTFRPRSVPAVKVILHHCCYCNPLRFARCLGFFHLRGSITMKTMDALVGPFLANLFCHINTRFNQRSAYRETIQVEPVHRKIIDMNYS